MRVFAKARAFDHVRPAVGAVRAIHRLTADLSEVATFRLSSTESYLREQGPCYAARMRKLLLRFAALILVASLAHAADAPTYRRDDTLKLVSVAEGFDHPVFVCSAPGDTRLYVV